MSIFKIYDLLSFFSDSYLVGCFEKKWKELYHLGPEQGNGTGTGSRDWRKLTDLVKGSGLCPQEEKPPVSTRKPIGSSREHMSVKHHMASQED